MKKIISITLVALFFLLTISYGGINDPYRNGYIEGYLTKVAEDKVQIEEYDGTVHQLDFDRDIVFKIDSTIVKLSDMKKGLEVYGTLRGKRLLSLEGYSTSNLGYISAGSKMLLGTIKNIDRDTLTIKTITGDEKLFFVSPMTIVTKNEVNTSIDELYIGDEVKLYFDQYDTNIISRMEIRNNSIKIKDIYKAKLSQVDEINYKLTLENIYNFENGKWSKLKGMEVMEYNYDTPIYMKSQKIYPDKLKYFKGKTVYIAVENFFGQDKIKRLVLQDKYSHIYSDKIRRINHYSDSFELRSRKNLVLGEGTIILKNNRLVDSLNIEDENDALIIGDGYKNNIYASVINIYDKNINNNNNSRKYIYAGRMNRIFEDSVYLKDFYILKKNEWYSFSTDDQRDEKRLYYDEDTQIFNLETGEILSTEEFFSSNFSVDEDDDEIDHRELNDWYSYFYTDSDHINVAYMKKDLDSLGKQRITIGKVFSIEDSSSTGWTLNLISAKDWSDYKEQWVMKKASININLEKALIVKNNVIIKPSELQAGDDLYIIRDDYNSKIVIVK